MVQEGMRSGDMRSSGRRLRRNAFEKFCQENPDLSVLPSRFVSVAVKHRSAQGQARSHAVKTDVGFVGTSLLYLSNSSRNSQAVAMKQIRISGHEAPPVGELEARNDSAKGAARCQL